MSNFLVREGLIYVTTKVDEYACDSCRRITMTGLCGCPEPSPKFYRKIDFCTPYSGSISEVLNDKSSG